MDESVHLLNGVGTGARRGVANEPENPLELATCSGDTGDVPVRLFSTDAEARWLELPARQAF
jgi:hypothetical protein